MAFTPVSPATAVGSLGHCTVPPDCTAQYVEPPTATDSAFENAVTCAGTGLPVTLLIVQAPQHHTLPSDSTANDSAELAVTETTPLKPATWVGVASRCVVLAAPLSEVEFSPQHQTPPAEIAHACP